MLCFESGFEGLSFFPPLSSSSSNDLVVKHLSLNSKFCTHIATSEALEIRHPPFSRRLDFGYQMYRRHYTCM